MKKNIKISPSILSCDFSNIEKVCEDMNQWGVDFVHCDVMDGVFVPNLTFGADIVRCFKKHTNIPLDVHLMITKPETYVPDFIDAGADLITFHPNASERIGETLQLIKRKGVKCGLAINPDISLEVVKPYIDSMDVLMLMSVYAGFGGQKFIPSTLQKIEEARKIIKENTLLEIDGGITPFNAKDVAMAGGDILVAGSAVFKSQDPYKAVFDIKNCLIY